MRAKPVPMPGNPGGKSPGDKSGLWRVEIKFEDGSKEYEYENVTYEEAFQRAQKRNREFNS